MKNSIKASVIIFALLLATGCGEHYEKQKAEWEGTQLPTQIQYKEGDLMIHKLSSDTLMYIRDSSGGTSLLLRDKTHELRSFKKFEVTILK